MCVITFIHSYFFPTYSYTSSAEDYSIIKKIITQNKFPKIHITIKNQQTLYKT